MGVLRLLGPCFAEIQGKFDEQSQHELILAPNFCGRDMRVLIVFKLNNEIIEEDLFEIRCIYYA